MTQHGVTYDFEEITEEVRAHMELALARGNHTWATNDLEFLENLVAYDKQIDNFNMMMNMCGRSIMNKMMDKI